MKKILVLFSFLTSLVVYSQSEAKQYFDKNGSEKIADKIVVDGKPIAAKSYDDGHGRNPFLTSTNQIPDTLALITYYVYDQGTEINSGNVTYTYNLSEKGGNYFANQFYNQSIELIKKSFKDQGIVVLTPKEYLNTNEKINFYNNFTPNLSKLGSFLTGLEHKNVNVAVAADNFRGFDVSACSDHERMESLGYDLAKGLNVDGVLSISINMVSNKKELYIIGYKMAINAPNPIEKKDKKYVSQNFGAGYYKGQLFAGGNFTYKSPVKIAKFKKEKIEEEYYDGIGEVLACFPAKFMEEIKKSIEKNSK